MDPKGITYVRFILKIESDAKMRLANKGIQPETADILNCKSTYKYMIDQRSAVCQKLLVS